MPRSFYERPTLDVALELLGKILIVRTPEGECGGRIVETEAYHGCGNGADPASHSARGMTPRNRVMFGPGGVAYVYFIYGNYQMLNFVTEREGYPGAVLIRAVEPLWGEPLMNARRKRDADLKRRELTNGPGKLCAAMGVQREHQGTSLEGPAIEVRSDGWSPARIHRSPRVGITNGQEKLWRYFVADHPSSDFVSRAPQNKMARLLRRALR